MKLLLALAILGFALSSCSAPKSNGPQNNNIGTSNNNSNNSTPAASPKEKFIGTWERPADDEAGLLTMTINRDDTFVIQLNRVGEPDAKTTKGKYTVRDEKMFLDGEVGKDVPDGFKLDGNRLVGLADHGKQPLYFDKK